MLKLSMNELDALFQELASDRTLYLPLSSGGQANFGPWRPEARVCLDRLKTVQSAKDFFFPQTEDLVSFKRQGKNISIVDQNRPVGQFAVFGMRGCDVRSLDVLDRVFLSEPIDAFYRERRENGVVISTACEEPDETCFCSVFGIDASEPQGDVVTRILGDVLYWEPKTPRGETLTEKVKSLFTEADAQDQALVAGQKADIKARVAGLPLASLCLDAFREGTLLEKFHSPVWARFSQACAGCGTCTFVCPTCQCYDIQDFDTGHDIRRFRCWDSCMYSDFTLMAHGNPRSTQMERFRQRFMHKLVYFPANNDGEYSCVGCGRCVEKCPFSLNIVRVIKAFGGGDKCAHVQDATA
ncbi:MAG: 4Fe-4S dicluster domain-containing protein [Synergistaceae bacterium]|jgi:ferredoxin|nr:4Fe-4S dicluster domain-containing protein [Synergistaceae bacterium]